MKKRLTQEEITEIEEAAEKEYQKLKAAAEKKKLKTGLIGHQIKNKN